MTGGHAEESEVKNQPEIKLIERPYERLQQLKKQNLNVKLIAGNGIRGKFAEIYQRKTRYLIQNSL